MLSFYSSELPTVASGKKFEDLKTIQNTTTASTIITTTATTNTNTSTILLLLLLLLLLLHLLLLKLSYNPIWNILESSDFCHISYDFKLLNGLRVKNKEKWE